MFLDFEISHYRHRNLFVAFPNTFPVSPEVILRYACRRVCEVLVVCSPPGVAARRHVLSFRLCNICKKNPLCQSFNIDLFASWTESKVRQHTNSFSNVSSSIRLRYTTCIFVSTTTGIMLLPDFPSRLEHKSTECAEIVFLEHTQRARMQNVQG